MMAETPNNAIGLTTGRLFFYNWINHGLLLETHSAIGGAVQIAGIGF